jgi:hypothetical protein
MSHRCFRSCEVIIDIKAGCPCNSISNGPKVSVYKALLPERDSTPSKCITIPVA